MNRAMTSKEATERFECPTCKEQGSGACEFECVLSETCSLLCPACRRAAYMQGSYHNNPPVLQCPHCGASIKNKFAAKGEKR